MQFMNLLRPTFVHIHLDRLMTNFRRLESFHPHHNFLCPMIKANAYGHGDIAVAKSLEKVGCQFVGVSSVEEGLHLRKFNVALHILTFGFYGDEAVEEMLAHNLTPVVSNFDQLESLSRLTKKNIMIHLKFNTGMNRLGFSIGDLNRIMDLLVRNPFIKIEGLCTHLHSGENISDHGSSSFVQVQLFDKITRLFNSPIQYQHVYNSAAMLSIYKTRKDFAFGSRPGLLVYGIDPTENLSIKPLISPVMEFKSKIVGLQHVRSGEVVSYSGTWTAPKDTLVGIVPAGYADGIMRSLSNCGEVLVCGKRSQILGRVCMDYTMIDLSLLKNQKDSLIGEEVVFWGEQGQEAITVEEVALKGQHSIYEVMTGVSERVPRTYGVIA